MTNVEVEDILINFGFSSKEEKKELLRCNPDKKVFLDLTCFDPEEFYSEFSNLHGTFSALFCDKNKKVEIHLKHKNESFLSQMRLLGFTTLETSILSCGFIFPRTIAQIINEAYYALEDGIASKEDIDRAMKFGVNYPRGPFEWASGKEKFVVTLLEELFLKTKDPRYKCCELLRKKA